MFCTSEIVKPNVYLGPCLEAFRRRYAMTNACLSRRTALLLFRLTDIPVKRGFG